MGSSPLAQTAASVFEIELSIIWINFRDLAISRARKSRLFIPIATNPTINAITTPKSKTTSVKSRQKRRSRFPHPVGPFRPASFAFGSSPSHPARFAGRHTHEAAGALSPDSGDTHRQASAPAAQRPEKTLVLFREFVPIPALRVSECSRPVLSLKFRVIPQPLDHSHPRRDLVCGRHHVARRRAPIRNRKHKPGIPENFG